MSMLAKFPTFTSILGKQTSLNSLKVIFFNISTPPGEGVRSGDYREEEEGKKRDGERREREGGEERRHAGEGKEGRR